MEETTIPFRNLHSREQSFDTLDMADPDDSYPDTIDGRSLLGFSLTSPDSVICAGSPDISCNGYGNIPKSLKNRSERNDLASIELSLDESITGLETAENPESPARKISAFFLEVQTSNVDMVLEVSFELSMKSTSQDKCPRTCLPVLSINAGGDAYLLMGLIS